MGHCPRADFGPYEGGRRSSARARTAGATTPVSLSLPILRPQSRPPIIPHPIRRRVRLRHRAYEALGWVLSAVGVVGTLLPLHLGAPVLVVGLIIVLRTSRRARRQFIGLQRRHPKAVFPIRRLLRRKPEVLPVAWQQVLRSERMLLPRRWRPARRLRRWLFRPRRPV
jgi:hypothetical protein